MQVNTESKPYDTINVTPMLDLAYVLLVVFILMTTASIQGLNVSMPKPSNKPSTEQHELKIVQITPTGAVLLNGVGVTPAELESQLKAAQARDPKMTVAIKGDPTTQYAKVVAVVDLLSRLNVNMGLVTARIGT
jgi:biopolymer transport protein ExbD